MSAPGFYAPDLAAVHHEAFGALADASAGVVIDELARRGDGSGCVVDLGCGSGRLARRLVDAGFDVVGIDLSPDFIHIARRAVPEARFREESLLDAALPPAVAVTAIGEAINYAHDGRGVGEARLAPVLSLFRRVYAALVPGGLFVFDAAGPGRAGPGGRNEAFHDHDDWGLYVAVEESGATLTRDITVFRRIGVTYRRSVERHSLALYAPGDLERGLREAGFRVRRRRAYGDVDLPHGLTAFVATKPAADR